MSVVGLIVVSLLVVIDCSSRVVWASAARRSMAACSHLGPAVDAQPATSCQLPASSGASRPMLLDHDEVDAVGLTLKVDLGALELFQCAEQGGLRLGD